MSLRQTEDVDRPASSTHSNSNWTVLVRVGKESWHIGDVGDNKGDSDGGASADWEKAARHFRRRSKYSVQMRYMIRDWLRQLWKNGETFLSHYLLGRNSTAAGSYSVSKRFRDSLQLGLLAGLVLGCFSLILFHQMAPATSTGNMSRKNAVVTQPASSAGSTAPIGSPALTLPAFHLYSLDVGSYSTQKAAASFQQKLQKKGIWSVVVPINKKYNVLTETSMYSGSLKQAAADLKKKTGAAPSIATLNYAVNRVPLQPGLSTKQARTLTAWLTNVVSSLNTITAAVENGEPVRDAKTTYDAAVKLMPPAATLRDAVPGKRLISLKESWQAAYSALEKKHSSTAQRESLLAYSVLLDIQNQN